MNPSSGTTGEMKEGLRLHSPNPHHHHHQDRGHIPSCNRLLQFFFCDATSKKGQIAQASKRCLLPGPSVLHWKHLGSGRKGRGVHIHTCGVGTLSDTQHSGPSTQLPCKVPRSWNWWANGVKALWTHSLDHVVSEYWLRGISPLRVTAAFQNRLH